MPSITGQPGLRTDVAEAQHPRPVGNDGNAVGLVAVLIDQGRIPLDGAARRGHAGRVPEAKSSSPRIGHLGIIWILPL